MNRRDIIIVAAVAAALVVVGVGGFLAGRGGPQVAIASDPLAVRKPLYWVSSMDPTYRRDKPGKDSMGMDLVPVYPSGNGGGTPSDVQISSAVVNNIGVRTAVVQQGSLAHRIETVGYVGYDENTLATIDTRAEGWIEKLDVKAVGDTVKRGQRLYELFSPKLATAETEYLTALSSHVPDLIAAARERLRALGFSGGQIQELARTRHATDRVARYADSNGVVVSLGVREGAYVTPAMEVMKVADLSTVWVLAEIDEADAAQVSTGQKAVAEFDTFPGQPREGRVEYVYPDMNAATRTAKVRLRFDNADGKLQPNMYAHVAILASPDHEAVYIPSSALIRTGQSERVALALGDGRYDICPVVAGYESGGVVQILKGLVPGQKVVVSSQFLIDSEANLDAAALRLGADRSQCDQAARVQTGMNANPPATAPPPKSNGSTMIMPDGSVMKMPSQTSAPAKQKPDGTYMRMPDGSLMKMPTPAGQRDHAQ
ncbi:MAG: efflux RND transporter periplasmic adaptor subunit [Alphaproteobacteria bacterium]|nr:efflux RND transporter periplasmic adaptor subunit [Alphaproteobacteria bacterium]MDE2630187.1 efflux RND transporter periplasmic adaptor subunit [Alphaproteobacteria bacterium]